MKGPTRLFVISRVPIHIGLRACVRAPREGIDGGSLLLEALRADIASDRMMRGLKDPSLAFRLTRSSGPEKELAIFPVLTPLDPADSWVSQFPGIGEATEPEKASLGWLVRPTRASERPLRVLAGASLVARRARNPTERAIADAAWVLRQGERGCEGLARDVHGAVAERLERRLPRRSRLPVTWPRRRGRRTHGGVSPAVARVRLRLLAAHLERLAGDIDSWVCEAYGRLVVNLRGRPSRDSFDSVARMLWMVGADPRLVGDFSGIERAQHRLQERLGV